MGPYCQLENKGTGMQSPVPGGATNVQVLICLHCQIYNKNIPYDNHQCCGSGMFYPGSDHCSTPDPGGKKHRIPDPTYFCIKAINKFCFLIPAPGGKKALDPGSGSAILVTTTVAK
jgi:hypothetical protein